MSISQSRAIHELGGIPVNRVAVSVMSKSKIDDRYSEKENSEIMWKNPRLHVDVPVCERKNPHFVDLTGSVVFRLRVTGYLGGGKWQCRCVCGNYTSRKTRAIRSKGNTVDSCVQCRELAFLKRENAWRTTGKHANIEDYY